MGPIPSHQKQGEIFTSLIDPSVGDLLDRFSILRLKIHHGSLAGKNVAHFEEERIAILSRLPQGLDFDDASVQELAYVNECLWELTDAMREAIGGGRREEALQATYGRIIHRFNDKRAKLIQEISEAHGDKRVEKIS